MDHNKIENEISSIIAEALKKHQDVHIKNLGTFSVHHRKKQQEQEKSGRIFLVPPADVITFVFEQ